jgi:hypothetical protein
MANGTLAAGTANGMVGTTMANGDGSVVER